MIVDFTAPDDIRAILGVTVDDLSDATIMLSIYEQLLLTDLEAVDDSLDVPALYNAAMLEASPTAAQERLIRTTKTFATFSVAKQLCTSLPLFAIKQETDSKAGMTRFDNPYKEVIASIGRDYDRSRNKLKQALVGINAGGKPTVSRPYFSKSSPSSDPITGV